MKTGLGLTVLVVFGLLCLALGVVGFAASAASSASDAAAVADARATLPPGPKGAFIKYGRDLFTATPRYAGKYVTAHMSCAACHIDAGTKPGALSLLGAYAKFPQWNARAHRFIGLQDRIAECFVYSMNGRPPPYYGREMEALTTYLAFLSRGAPVGKGFPGQAMAALMPTGRPDPANGAKIYAAKCALCHGVDGAGNAPAFPPLWGPYSFNSGAGMHKLDMMASFVKTNMPANAPNTLSPQEAYDVSAFVLSHARPAVKGSQYVQFPREPKDFF